MNHFLKISLLLCGFGCIKPLESETFARDKEISEKYFKQQERIYHRLENLGIPGARPLSMDEALAESVLANCPKEVDEVISDFEHSVFSTNKKNIIFHGPSGTGKSVLAQAIAIKCKVPCLFFNVGTISTEYKDSGVQNLNKIFKYAQELEKSLGEPCIVIFDELEALTKKHAGTNNSENNILVSFWQELDKLGNRKVIAIGTMNNTEDVPEEIINRTSMIKVPLPNLKQREAILSYHLKKRQDKYKLAYPEWLTGAYLALQTKRICNRDLENVVEEATRPVIKAPAPSDGSKKIVPGENFARVIKQIKKNSIENWKRTFKKHLRNPQITLPLAGMAAMLTVAYNLLSYQKKNMALQIANHKESIAVQKAHQKENIAMQEKSMALQIVNQAENVALQEKSMALQVTNQAENVVNHKESIATQIAHQEENIAMQEKGMALQVAHQKANVAHQKEAMDQAKKIADYQVSDKHMFRQHKINTRGAEWSKKDRRMYFHSDDDCLSSK